MGNCSRPQKAPQGGVISPLLANIALHGMETAIHQMFAHRTRKVGDQRKWVSKVQLPRYTDDFVIIHEDQAIVEAASVLISDWLTPMDLELKASKTRSCRLQNGYPDRPVQSKGALRHYLRATTGP